MSGAPIKSARNAKAAFSNFFERGFPSSVSKNASKASFAENKTPKGKSILRNKVNTGPPTAAAFPTTAPAAPAPIKPKPFINPTSLAAAPPPTPLKKLEILSANFETGSNILFNDDTILLRTGTRNPFSPFTTIGLPSTPRPMLLSNLPLNFSNLENI